jgi:iron(III) transport system substrate-binding protein
MVASWGHFKADELPLNDVANLRGDAIRMIDEVGFNE